MVVTIGTVAINVGGHMTNKYDKEKDIASDNFYDKFQKQLAEGETYEELFKEFMVGKDIEVKTESYKWVQTGNHYLEFAQLPKGAEDKEENFVPSGISVTKSYWWAVFLRGESDELGKAVIAYVIPVHIMKEMKRKLLKERGYTRGGDGNRTKGVLVPIEMIAMYPFNR